MSVCAEQITLSLSDAFPNAIQHNKTITYYDIEKNNAEMELAYQKGIYIPQLGLTAVWDQYEWESENIDKYSCLSGKRA